MNDTLDPRALRVALGHFATGVAVVTASAASGPPIGMTVNSFSSVSLDPPLILFSIDKRAFSLDAFRAARGFAVNVLSGHQRELSARFAHALSDKWVGVGFHVGHNGAPLLQGALAHFECVPWADYDGGDHLIFVCRILRFALAGGSDPLVFFAGRYATLERGGLPQEAQENGAQAGGTIDMRGRP